jgi:hypothetical protein
MAFEEKRAWIAGIGALVGYLTYLTVVVVRSRDVPVTDIAYAGPLLIIIAVGVVASVAAHVVIGLRAPDEAGRTDERDRQIDRMGKHTAQSFVAIGSVGALVLALLEWDHFWIANVLVLAFFLSAMCEAVAKIFGYRRAFPPW